MCAQTMHTILAKITKTFNVIAFYQTFITSRSNQVRDASWENVGNTSLLQLF